MTHIDYSQPNEVRDHAPRPIIRDNLHTLHHLLNSNQTDHTYTELGQHILDSLWMPRLTMSQS